MRICAVCCLARDAEAPSKKRKTGKKKTEDPAAEEKFFEVQKDEQNKDKKSRQIEIVLADDASGDLFTAFEAAVSALLADNISYSCIDTPDDFGFDNWKLPVV